MNIKKSLIPVTAQTTMGKNAGAIHLITSKYYSEKDSFVDDRADHVYFKQLPGYYRNI